MNTASTAHLANAAQIAQFLAPALKHADKIPVMLTLDQLPADCSDAYQALFQVAVHAVSLYRS
ncbi:hypothetical protein D3C84_1202680 [compost metagenome]